MKLKNLLKDKTTQIVLISILANMALLYFLVQTGVDALSILVYMGVGILVTKLANIRKLNGRTFFILGGAISLAYNGLGHTFQLFEVSLFFLVIAAAQQAIVTLVTSKIMGVKK